MRILFKSHIGLCVYDQTHKGIGVVTYNSPKGGYIDDHKQWSVTFPNVGKVLFLSTRKLLVTELS